MTEEHFHGVMSSNQLNDHQKRKRTPSQYASRIENFKIVLMIICSGYYKTAKKDQKHSIS